MPFAVCRHCGFLPNPIQKVKPSFNPALFNAEIFAALKMFEFLSERRETEAFKSARRTISRESPKGRSQILKTEKKKERKKKFKISIDLTCRTMYEKKGRSRQPRAFQTGKNTFPSVAIAAFRYQFVRLSSDMTERSGWF